MSSDMLRSTSTGDSAAAGDALAHAIAVLHIISKMILVALPLFMRVLPVTTSGPTTGFNRHASPSS
jgi:hypothetical protein